jgi:hypothetical protein
MAAVASAPVKPQASGVVLTRPTRVFTPATSIFVVTRLVIWGGAAFAFDRLPHHGGGPGAALWARVDSGWYLEIARHGYGSDPQHLAAFFPLYPGLVAVLGRALGDFVLAGVLVSLVSGAIAFELLWRLALPRISASGATRAVLYLALFPMTVFLGAVYTESLFLVLCVGAFFLAERDHWAWAAVAAGGAMLTRSVGIAVFVGLAVMAWPRVEHLAWLLVAPAMFAVFPVVLHFQAHDAFAFVHAQAQWDRHLSRLGPIGGLWNGVEALWRHSPGFSRRYYLFTNIEDLAYLLFFTALLPLVWRRVGKPYFAFAALALAIPASLPAREIGGVVLKGDFPLFSMPRFTVAVFPCFIALAIVGERRWANIAILVVSSALLTIATMQWTLGSLG